MGLRGPQQDTDWAGVCSMTDARQSAGAAYRGYGQYCPLALAAELLCRRWTLLVVSRLLDGCATFTEIQQGVPRISPSLLSARLGELEDAGLVVREPREGGHGHRYALTESGRALDSIVMDLAAWGQQWGRDMTHDDLDPAFLAWSMHTRLDTAAMPEGRTVIEFRFSGTPSGHDRFWLVHEAGCVDMCLKDPGHQTDVLVCADIRRFVECWRGFRDLRQEIRQRQVQVMGDPALTGRLPDWLQRSALAEYPRRRTGPERRLAHRHTD